jgi:hypothetical protein
MLLARTNTLPKESLYFYFYFYNTLSVFSCYFDSFLYNDPLEVDNALVYSELFWPSVSAYCFKNAELGGQAANEIGRTLGKGACIKNSSFKTSSIVDLLEGSLMSILEINFLVLWQRGTLSGKL